MQNQRQQFVMCKASSAELYSRCIEAIQKVPQRAIQRLVINLYRTAHVREKHCCNLLSHFFFVRLTFFNGISLKRSLFFCYELAVVDKVLV